MGKPLASTVAPATAATSNFTTVASALGTMTSSVVSSLPGNDTVGSCYKLTSYWGNLWRPLDDPDYPWLGLWTSLFITSVWYFCTDQVTTLWNWHVSIVGALITCSYKLNEANTFKQSFSVLMWHLYNIPTVDCKQSYFFLRTRAQSGVKIMQIETGCCLCQLPRNEYSCLGTKLNCSNPLKRPLELREER